MTNNTIYIGFVAFSVNHSAFCIYNEDFVAEIANTFVNENDAVEWTRKHGENFVDRRTDSSAIVATNVEDDKEFFTVAVKVGEKQRVRICNFHGHYVE